MGQDVRALYEADQFEEAAAKSEGATNPDDLLFRGLALARLRRWAEARTALESGWTAAPGDGRFPTELAGLAYRESRQAEARRLLRKALRLNNVDTPYVRDFLGTLYLLDGNLEAALLHWNDIGKPILANVETPQSFRTDPILLDRTFAVAPTELLTLAKLRETQARFRVLDVLAGLPQFDLPPVPGDDRYHLRLRAAEKGTLSSPLLTLASWLKGLPYQTVSPRVENFAGRARQLSAAARWNPNRRRLALGYSSPLPGEPSKRWRVFADARDERWSLESNAAADLHLRKAELGGGFESAINGTHSWSWESAVSVRSYRSGYSTLRRAPDAAGIRTSVSWDSAVLRLEERRFEVHSHAAVGVGRIFKQTSGLYGRAEVAINARWTGSRNWTAESHLAGAALTAHTPFDELDWFGVDIDSAVGFRGDRVAKNGRKGAAHLGDRHWLATVDLTRRVPLKGFLDVRAGPFFQVGRVHPVLGSASIPTQLAAGARVDVRVLGVVGASLLWARNLQTGGTVWFARPTP